MRRHDFASDNVAGAMPEALEALSRFNGGFAASYGEDEISARAGDLIRELLGADAEVWFMACGTAANAIAVAALAAPHEAVIAHEHAHVAIDETGAPAFFGAGLGVITAPGPSGRIDRSTFERVVRRTDDPHWQAPAALSLTNATEYGAVYSEADLTALVAVAKAHGLKVHLDGARLANAIAAGFDPTTPARSGVDTLVLGGAKAGSTPTEALVLLDKSLSRRFGARLKHARQLVSKARFLAAPWIGMLETKAWQARAAHANAMARRLEALTPFPIVHPVEANAVFMEMDEAALGRLNEAGWFVWRASDKSARFMCSWATTAEAVDALGADLRALAPVKAIGA
ncbi:MAG: beta-eliminating lyase-related protein [Caulobacteraceae bacterium]